MIRQKQKIGTQTRKESVQSILYAYLFLICTALPLYMKNGYYELGEAKFLFYRNLSLGTITVLLPFIMFQIPRSTKWREEDDLKMPLCLYAFSKATKSSIVARAKNKSSFTNVGMVSHSGLSS